MGRSIILTDGEVALAVPEKEDFQLDVINDPFVLSWASNPSFFYTDPEEAFKEVQHNGPEKTFSILYRGEFVGLCGWKWKEAPIPQIWFGLYRNRFKGIGARAIKLMLLFLFLFENQDAAFAITRARNVAAQRAMEKAGMKVFGKTRKSFRTRRKKEGAVWMVAYADHWLKENQEYVANVLKRSGYPTELFI
ncbi:MAG: GNAT family N-acetyltransferase [Candidatus Diapherotrites archaeon]|nr:GNAT family N-acetyltransferase [Candidatus Diapherotrites archaeon]